MHLQMRIHHWVVWWFYLGVICGIIALANILWRDLSPPQIKLVLAFGVLHWVLGGVVCYCLDSVKIEPSQPSRKDVEPRSAQQTEWHSASDFLLPGSRKSILPPKY